MKLLQRFFIKYLIRFSRTVEQSVCLNSKLEIEAKQKQFKIERRQTPDCQTEFGQEAKLIRKSSIFTSTRSYKENFQRRFTLQ